MYRSAGAKQVDRSLIDWLLLARVKGGKRKWLGMSVGGRLQKQSKAPGCRDKGFEVTSRWYHLLVYTVVCPYEFVCTYRTVRHFDLIR
jgi:hypothetical protein